MRVIIQVDEGISISDSLNIISDWVKNHYENPDLFPMTGVISRGNLTVFKRDYRKSSCFVVLKNKGRE